MKSGVSISRPQEPRWIGLSVGSLAKNLLFSMLTSFHVSLCYLRSGSVEKQIKRKRTGERRSHLSIENSIFSL
jgi:hypothetical protein